jgi:hypothetical protein
MNKQTNIPTDLRIVAFLFIIEGILAIIDMIVGIAHERFSVNFGFIAIFIGRGLLKFNVSWRKIATMGLWIWNIAGPLVALYFLFFNSGDAVRIQFLGYFASNITRIELLVVMATTSVLSIWSTYVLYRKPIKELFGISDDKTASTENE